MCVEVHNRPSRPISCDLHPHKTQLINPSTRTWRCSSWGTCSSTFWPSARARRTGTSPSSAPPRATRVRAVPCVMVMVVLFCSLLLCFNT